MTLTDFFIALLNMSLSATWAALLVMAARALLKRAPKIFSYSLWAVVLFRMVCPVSFQWMFSLMPVSPKTIPEDIIYASQPQIHSGIRILDQAVNGSLPAGTPAASVNPIQIFLAIAAFIWMMGVVLLLICSLVSYLRFRHMLCQAVREEENIFSSDRITTAFVLGFFRPRIYLPLGLGSEERQYILCHEQVHIHRKDHWIKAASLLALFFHWFNPVLWFAYRLMCRDMEMSCDERVMDKMGTEIRKDYSGSLLSISMRRSGLSSPLAFGEKDVSGRIKNILRYKKPAFGVLLVILILVTALTVGLASNPLNTIPLSQQTGIPYHDVIWGETVKVVMPGKTNSYLLENDQDLEELSALISSLEVTRQPLSQNRDENRPWDFSLEFRRPPEVSVGNFTLYFTAGSVWGNDGVKPSLSYGLSDEETGRLLQALEGYIVRASGNDERPGGYYVGFRQVVEGEEQPLIAGEDSQTGTLLASLLLSGMEVQETVAETPPVESYLLIQMGEPETVYYVYQSEGKFYMEKAGEYRLKMTRETYDGILETYRSFAQAIEESSVE